MNDNHIEIDSREIDKTLKKLLKALTDTAPVMREAAAIMEDAVFENFESEGQGKWPELSDATKDARKKRGQTPLKMLQVHGMNGGLLGSVISESDIDSAEVAVAGKSEDLGKAWAHQEGTDKAGKHRNITIKARPFLYLTDEDEKKIINVMEEAISKAFK